MFKMTQQSKSKVNFIAIIGLSVTVLGVAFSFGQKINDIDSRAHTTSKIKEKSEIHLENAFFSELEAKTLVKTVTNLDKEFKVFKEQKTIRDSLIAVQQKKRDSLDLLNKATIYEMKETQKKVLQALEQLVNKKID